MMFLLLVLIFVVSLPKAAGSYRQRQAQLAIRKLSALETIQATPEGRQDKKFTREQLAAAKAAAQAEKRRQAIEQAQADKQFYLAQLEKIGDMILTVDDELERINQAIEIDKATRSYDAEIKDSKRKEQIMRKLATLENKQHTIESKLAKAIYIINQAGA